MKAFQRYRISLLLLIIVLAWTLAACGSTSNTTASSTPTPGCNVGNSTPPPTLSGPGITVNLGYFPNITHAAALVGLSCGTFAKDLAPNTIKETRFNVGSDLVSALLAGSIDISYVGPSPAANGYVKSNGSALRIIAGASSGGVLFVVQPDENITKASDLHGKKIGDPGAGGTQDVSLRHYLQQNGLSPSDKSGDVTIVPSDNSTIVNEFKLHQLDGAWMPEPYASRLVVEGKGKIFLDERDLWPNKQFVTTNVIVRTAFLQQHPDIVNAFLKAHVDTIRYINANLIDAKNRVNQELASFPGGTKLDQRVLDDAFSDLIISYDPLAPTLFAQANNALALGAIKKVPDAGIYDLDPVNTILTSEGLSTVSAS
jgi:NitT/TauT family transport system substrate-binding protein